MSERIQNLIDDTKTTTGCPSCQSTDIANVTDEEMLLSGLDWVQCQSCRLVFIRRVGERNDDII